MSRSFKHQPFMSICGNGSAKQDKRLANRGVRKAHREALHKALIEQNYDVLLPHRLECSWNETYSWGRDGHQMYHGLDAIRRHNEYLENWPPQWYVQMMRK